VSDQRLRELERRFKETGEPAAWGAWLRARVRQGSLDAAAVPLAARIEAGALARERVQLAGYLGDPLALALDEHDTIALAVCLGDDAAVRVALDDYYDGDVEGWLVGLAHWGGEPWVRAAVACAIQAREASRANEDADDPYSDVGHYEEMTDRLLEGVLRWLDCPCAQHGQDALRDAQRYEYVSRHSVSLAYLACQVAWAFSSDSAWPDAYALELLERVGAREAVATIRAALIPWALGTT